MDIESVARQLKRYKATVGIDPGARDTGVIAINAKGTAARGFTVHNDGDLLPVPHDYLTAVIEAVDEAVALAGEAVTVKVESITRPNWHVAKERKNGSAANPAPLIGTAQVLGAVMAAYPDSVLVPPGKNGSSVLSAYPDFLIGPREKVKTGWQSRVGGGILRHQRSAWDVACYDTRFAA
jgi:hypothetical protein